MTFRTDPAEISQYSFTRYFCSFSGYALTYVDFMPDWRPYSAFCLKIPSNFMSIPINEFSLIPLIQ